MRRMRHLTMRSIQGCQLELDASAPTSLYDATSGGNLVADAAVVARWEDRSGNGYHVTQGTAGARPTRQATSMNGTGGLQFDGGDSLAQSAVAQSKYLHLSAGATFALVAHFGSGSDPNTAYVLAGNNAVGSANVGFGVFFDDRVAVPASNRFGVSVTRGSVGFPTNNSTQNDVITPNTPVAASVLLDNGNATANLRSRVRINCVAEYGNNAATDAASSADPTYVFTVGTSNAVFPHVGYIGLIAGWNRLLGASVRARINQANMRKWRING